MDEQREKSTLSESWSETARYWFPGWRDIFSPAIVLISIMAVAVLLSSIAIPNGTSVWKMVAMIFHWACCLSLAVGLSIFAAVKGGWKIYLAAFLLLWLDGIALASIYAPRVEFMFILFPLLTATPILITLESIRFFLGTFTNAEILGQPLSEGFQFRIKHLFIATTVLAVMILTVQSLSPRFSGYLSFYLFYSMIVVLLSINALVSVWAMLGKAVGTRWLVSLIVASVTLAAYLFELGLLPGVGVPSSEIVIWASCIASPWASSMLLLYLLRREGYRFVRHTK